MTRNINADVDATASEIIPYITVPLLVVGSLSTCPPLLIMTSFPSVDSVVVGVLSVVGGSNGVLDAFSNWKDVVGGDVSCMLERKGCSPNRLMVGEAEEDGMGEMLG